MSGRASYKLSTGMLVSDPPPPPKDKATMISSAPRPYTGGDPRFSGEISRMFEIFGDRFPSSSSSRSHSFPAPARRTSGPALAPTGLITSENAVGSHTEASSQAPAAAGVIKIEREIGFWFWLPKAWLWVCLVSALLSVGVGVFVWVAVGRPEILLAVAGACAAVAAAALWNWARGWRELERYFKAYPESAINLRNLPANGSWVKITGLVTCGNISMESSYQNVPRCSYTFIELYECKGKQSLKYYERFVADFYVSDLSSGTTCLEELEKEQDISTSEFTFRLEEGYIKE